MLCRVLGASLPAEGHAVGLVSPQVALQGVRFALPHPPMGMHPQMGSHLFCHERRRTDDIYLSTAVGPAPVGRALSAGRPRLAHIGRLRHVLRRHHNVPSRWTGSPKNRRTRTKSVAGEGFRSPKQTRHTCLTNGPGLALWKAFFEKVGTSVKALGECPVRPRSTL